MRSSTCERAASARPLLGRCETRGAAGATRVVAACLHCCRCGDCRAQSHSMRSWSEPAGRESRIWAAAAAGPTSRRAVVSGCHRRHMREPAVVHRDIKLSNILLRTEERQVACLGDFGLHSVRHCAGRAPATHHPRVDRPLRQVGQSAGGRAPKGARARRRAAAVPAPSWPRLGHWLLPCCSAHGNVLTLAANLISSHASLPPSLG